jgi:hypothetical protein
MGRPATGQTKVMGFRPPKPLRDEFEALAEAEDRTPSDALVEVVARCQTGVVDFGSCPPRPRLSLVRARPPS